MCNSNCRDVFTSGLFCSLANLWNPLAFWEKGWFSRENLIVLPIHCSVAHVCTQIKESILLFLWMLYRYWEEFYFLYPILAEMNSLISVSLPVAHFHCEKLVTCFTAVNIQCINSCLSVISGSSGITPSPSEGCSRIQGGILIISYSK